MKLSLVLATIRQIQISNHEILTLLVIYSLQSNHLLPIITTTYLEYDVVGYYQAKTKVDKILKQKEWIIGASIPLPIACEAIALPFELITLADRSWYIPYKPKPMCRQIDFTIFQDNVGSFICSIEYSAE